MHRSPFSAPFSIARLPVSPFSKLPVRHFGPFGIRFILTCCVMLRSVPTWSRMCCGTPRSLGRRSAAFSNTRFADSSVSPKMFDRVYGHHHPDHLAGGRIAGGNAATNVNKRERTRQKTLKIQENPGSEPRSGRGGRRFKSCHSDQHLAEFSSRFATGCAPG